MISKAKFMTMIRSYRDTAKVDITNHAINFAYAALQHGEKTALTLNLEKFFRRKVEDFEYVGLLQPQVKKGHSKGGKPGIDYLDRKLLTQVLDPDLNLPIKIETYKRAYKEGMRYVILECSRHGDVLHRVSVTVPRPGLKLTKNAYDGYCLICKTDRNLKGKEKLESIYQFQKNYMEYRALLKDQSAS